MQKLYEIRGGAGGDYCTGGTFHCLVVTNSEEKALGIAKEYAYEECSMCGVADNFISSYEDENDGAYPDEYEIDEEIETWMEYSVREVTEDRLAELYEEGEVTLDQYKRYKIFFSPNKVKISINNQDSYIDGALARVLLANNLPIQRF